MLEGIQRFANAKGATSKFHYTLTRAWVALIVHARRQHPDARTATALIAACPLLVDAHAIERFYSAETLGSDRAPRRVDRTRPGTRHGRAPLTVAGRTDFATPTRIPSTISRAVDAHSQPGVDTAPAALATADARGRPSVRMVLLRGADPRGFVFHTNYNSRKARDLTENAHAALCLHWPTLEVQIRIEGTVVRLPADESDAYFSGRPRSSQLGAWASEQSAVLPDRSVLEERIEASKQNSTDSRCHGRHSGEGFDIVPDRIEFWYGGTARLHDRIVYLREAAGWRTERLFSVSGGRHHSTDRRRRMRPRSVSRSAPEPEEHRNARTQQRRATAGTERIGAHDAGDHCGGDEAKSDWDDRVAQDIGTPPAGVARAARGGGRQSPSRPSGRKRSSPRTPRN